MSSWQKRLMRDIKDLQENGFVVVTDPDADISTFTVELHGPKDTPYAGGLWRVQMTVMHTFPFTSPSVGFVEHILHPNVDWSSGSICLDALNKKWTPVFTLRHIMDSLLPYLLTYPNPNDPLNRDAASLLSENPELYASKVIEATKRYAVKKDV